ncbi:thermolysin metallopeptidase, alpha-helical domain protein [Leptospira interrogans str. 2003000735]|uniref:Thermolysin metallopeptidase, alpha-helical domain protein n=2 Tax=Leptospira interrogans TaxID=173 RepID=N1UPQ8_LEPIR|nr:M4 family metallopeptidase [Leptospira interrogans]EMY25821.1 thermolysin metallopeptidase, alpha-helical domain protein [Leptospira interrogans serovar Australis str. 200703203]EKN87999.1 thermolysin metallopeptidase, alpha-helical domain protein [Leptospira interrogans str. 2002000624]EKQ40293.1 thermolysin metallopeptidase, alpha-helical domain protein [Leptospira interrogans str. 2002000621]EKQ46478.1 thermolysin metallopeptidase, alpha-helical domain protein [Leptospira interrogans str.
MENFKWLGIDLRLKILICIFSILFSCKDNKQEFGESWISLFNNVKMDEKAISDRHYSSDGTLTFATFNSDLVPYNRKQAPEVLKTYLQLTLNSEPVFLRSNHIGDYDHDRFQQRYKGIKVENGTYTVVSKRNTIESMMGEFYQVPENFNSSPKLSESEAFSKALKHFGAKKYIWESPEREEAFKKKQDDPSATNFPKGELLVYQHSLGKLNSQKEFRLVYKFGIVSIEPSSSRYVYVDSHSGEILANMDANRYEAGGGDTTPTTPQTPPDTHYGICFPDKTPCIKQGTAATRFSGIQSIITWTTEADYFELKDYSRGKGIVSYSWEFVRVAPSALETVKIPLIDTDNNWTKAEYHDDYNHDAVLDAHWGIEHTYDYFKSVHNRSSFDGEDAKIVNNVHYTKVLNFNNAHWNPITEELEYTYCPHDSSLCHGINDEILLDPRFEDFTSLDIASHEFGHAINAYAAGFDYNAESAALDEGFGDIWNVGVNHYVNKILGMHKNVWRFGDETVLNGGMRSLQYPNSATPVTLGGADTYYGDLWDFTNKKTHENGLVLGHWFYILSNGKSGINDHSCEYNTTGISIEKAEKIAYSTIHYLSPTSGYVATRSAAILAAKNLYGKFSSEVKSTIDAWDAVGVPAETTSRGGDGMRKVGNYITSVKLSGMENNSGNDCGYKDNTYLHPWVLKGGTYQLVLSSEGSQLPLKSHKWSVWIDLNRNGIFDSSEIILQTSNQLWGEGTLQRSIVIPTTALTGNTKMRVSMKAADSWEAYPRADEKFYDGEVEDYTISINSFRL